MTFSLEMFTRPEIKNSWSPFNFCEPKGPNATTTGYNCLESGIEKVKKLVRFHGFTPPF